MIASPQESPAEQRLIRAMILLGILGGAIHAWAARHEMWTDGICYLDMGDAFWRGDWKTAVNASWSPLYAWLVGLALLVLRPSPYWEFAVVHLVNFAAFLGALACFHFLLGEAICYNRRWRSGLPEESRLGLPDWAFSALGYAVFFWSSYRLIGLEATTPDMGVAALVYLATGLILRIRLDTSRTGTFRVLGIVLGFGYLAKSSMFPLAFLFLALAWFAARPAPQATWQMLLALAAFALIAAPWVAALSWSKGRLTAGDAARLNYAWNVNRTRPYTHWQGDPPGSGAPLHPTRKIFDPLPVYEFGGPVGGTYPPLYDDSYWYEGLRLHFSLPEQLKVLRLHARFYDSLLLRSQGGLVIATVLLYSVGRRRWSLLRDIFHHWILLVPAVVALGMYSMVHVEERYIAPFIVLFWMALFSGLRLPGSEDAKTLARAAAGTMLALLFVAIGLSIGRAVYTGILFPQSHWQWRIAQGLRATGLPAGASVAVIGGGIGSFWARIARLRIVAELPDREGFWSADPVVQSRAIAALATSGAKVLVSEPSRRNPGPGWQRIGATEYYIYLLAP